MVTQKTNKKNKNVLKQQKQHKNVFFTSLVMGTVRWWKSHTLCHWVVLPGMCLIVTILWVDN